MTARLGTRTALAVRTHSYSGKRLGDFPVLLRALLDVKAAAALANAGAGVLSKRSAASIARACKELSRAPAALFPADLLQGGGGIAVNTNLNEAIAMRSSAPEHPIDPFEHVNASQSSADVCATGVRLAAVAVSEELAAALAKTAVLLRGKEAAFADIQTLSRTCLRDASAVSLGKAFGAHAAVLERRGRGLKAAFGELRKINLGGTVIGSGEGAPAEYRRRVLGELRRLRGNVFFRRADLYDAARNSDDLGAAAKELGLLALVLIKIASDLRLLFSGPRGGFGEIILPKIIEGSSFYGGKSNPTIPETVLSACFQILGSVRSAEANIEHAELDLNVFDFAAGVNVIEAAGAAARVLPLFNEHCLKDLRADRERCAALALFLNSRRTGHDASAR